MLILGDSNGRVGNINRGIERVSGREEEAMKIDNSKRIIELHIDNGFVIANAKF